MRALLLIYGRGLRLLGATMNVADHHSEGDQLRAKFLEVKAY